MRPALFAHRCANGHRFTSPMLSDMAYGEFLLRSANGAIAHLDVFADPSFDQVTALVRARPEAAGLDPSQEADLIQGLYGPLACDPDSLGAAFEIGIGAICPDCGNRSIAWNLAEPPRPVAEDVPPVTHERWNSMTETARQERLDALLRGRTPD